MSDPFAKRPLVLAAATMAVIATGGLDYVTGYEVRLFPLYFLPVALVAWRVSLGAAILISLASTAAWGISNWLAGRVYASALTWPVNLLSQFVAFATVGILVAELQRRLQRERDLSRSDPLTSLPNSRAFGESARLLLALARRSMRPLTIAYLDLDNFKQLNDERGHQEGDRALAAAAEILRTHVRASDLVARLGGDEFAMLLFDTEPSAARSSLERLREAVGDVMRDHGWKLTVSIGAVCYLEIPPTLEAALREADAWMYRAKQAGKDRLQIAVVGARESAVELR